MNIEEFYRRVRPEAEASLAIVIRLVDAAWADRRTGGFLCAGRARNREPISRYLFHEEIGILPVEKRPKCKRLSREKVDRLAQNNTHLLSWQSQRPEFEEYQGSARASDGYALWYVGFSGLRAEDDECLVLIFFVRMGMLDLAEAIRRARISNNQLFFRATVADLLPLAA